MKKVVLLVFLMGAVLLGQAQTTLQLNLDKNVQYAYKVNSDQTIQQSVSGQQIAIKVKSYRSVNFKVIEKSNAGFQLEFAFDTILSSIHAPMMNLETNSAKPGNTPAEKLLNRLSNLRIQALIEPDGKFKSFVNYNTFRDSVLLVLDEVPASQKDQARKQAESLIKESAIQSMIEPLFAYLPDRAVQVGESWETTYMSTSNDITSVVVNAITLKELQGKTAKIGCESNLESMPSLDPNSAVQQELKGKSLFDGVVDLNTGLTISRSESGHFEGSVKTRQAGQDLTIPLVVDSKSEMKVLSVKR